MNYSTKTDKHFCSLAAEGFNLMNSRDSTKYGLRSLRKNPMEGTPTGPGPTSGQLALTLQPTNIEIHHFYYQK